ncbi:hypothetical protein LMG31887_26050 [Xanthomonas hydrangeae]|nr:hypothetical protein LMG31887_26050 [Xanthomonas hydrangeae]CAD7734271.1 hypothetical protein LMG31887_26050 [Xanthomonas hydrangeae]
MPSRLRSKSSWRQFTPPGTNTSLRPLPASTASSVRRTYGSTWMPSERVASSECATSIMKPISPMPVFHRSLNRNEADGLYCLLMSP